MSINEFATQNFEGPIDLLVHLAQKSEIDLAEVPLKEVTGQYLRRLEQSAEKGLEFGGEFLVATSSLLLMKSSRLLPGDELVEEEGEKDPDPSFDLLSHVVDYCRFREAGKGLIHLEERQGGHFPRGYFEQVGQPEQPSGLHHLSLDELADLLDDVMERAAKRAPKVIEDEVWSVAETSEWLTGQLALSKIAFGELFSPEKGREELIVNFLAVLEMMKRQAIAVVDDGGRIYLIRKSDGTGT